jgi:hypothetical protein
VENIQKKESKRIFLPVQTVSHFTSCTFTIQHHSTHLYTQTDHSENGKKFKDLEQAGILKKKFKGGKEKKTNRKNLIKKFKE